MNYGGMLTTGTPDKNAAIGSGTMQQTPQQTLMPVQNEQIKGMNKGGYVKKYAHGGGVRKVNY